MKAKKIIATEAKEAPEKIILNDYTDNIKIEYTRSDVFIEKACEWLSNNIAHYTDTQNDSEGYLCEVILEDALIGDFRKAMKGGEK